MKMVGVYIFQEKIGNGEFADVYKGYSRVDSTQVAIKTIRQDKIKNKFYKEKVFGFIQNQIRVLSCCQNSNIVRLIDIKISNDTINIIMQYCEDGDLSAYLKLKQKIDENQAVDYLVQILHGFQTLFRKKIMHRDFKLSNIFKSKNIIKIGDFGFSKFLQSEDELVEQFIGSPLNMAPEILSEDSYSSKADIWSIGVSFYEMLFGKYPFNGSNTLDLLLNIKSQPLTLPHKIPPILEDILRKMLTVNVRQRIEWNELFNHPLTRYRQTKFQKNIFFNLQQKQLQTNYQKCSKIVLHSLAQIMKNSSFSINLNKNGLDEQTIRQNSQNLLYQRIYYLFLGNLAEEILTLNKNIYAECLAFLMIKRVISIISNINNKVKNIKNSGACKWNLYEQSFQYKTISSLIVDQQKLFSELFEKLSLRIFSKDILLQLQEDMMISGYFTIQDTNKMIYEKVVRQYLKRIENGSEIVNYVGWIHICKILDTFDLQKLIIKNFDLKKYYNSFLDENRDIFSQNSRKRYIRFLKIKK